MTTILVIEDESVVRDYVIDVLRLEGYEAVGMADGLVGLEWTRANLPDLVVSDITMPKLDGYGVLHELHKQPHTATIPFIFLTANGERDQFRQGMELGADDYLTKPFKPSELLAAVRTQLEKQAVQEKMGETTLRLLRTSITYALPHELRTPLMSILGYAELLMMDHDQLQADAIFEMSKCIVQAGERLQRLIENYLTYAQIEIIESDPEQRQGVRNHIIKNCAEVIADEAAQQAQKAKRTADLKLELCNLALRIFEGDLRKIVAELVDNAFKFSEQGTEVVVASARDGSTFTLYVRDHGRGITPEHIKKIGAYMQFERAIYEQQGLGLGLILAKRLVELHEGRLDIQSKPSHGTLVSAHFSVY